MGGVVTAEGFSWGEVDLNADDDLCWINKECACADRLLLLHIFSLQALSLHRNWKPNLISNSEKKANELPLTSNASQLPLSLSPSQNVSRQKSAVGVL